MPESPLFSVVIPNWNGARHLPTCLQALCGQAYPNIEIIVADNNSQDESRALLQRDYPSIKVVALPTNRGFTGACNAGMQAAQGNYIALLNNDTEVDPNWAKAVIACFER